MKLVRMVPLLFGLTLTNNACIAHMPVSTNSTLSAGRAPASPKQGGADAGGGSGCMANFMSAAFDASEWLSNNGSKLKPAVKENAFLLATSPNDILITNEDLEYKGNPVDAFFDGSKIEVRCDRLTNDNIVNRRRVVAHEIFRKMGLEGDQYEISRQMFSINDPFVSGSNANGSQTDPALNCKLGPDYPGQKILIFNRVGDAGFASSTDEAGLNYEISGVTSVCIKDAGHLPPILHRNLPLDLLHIEVTWDFPQFLKEGLVSCHVMVCPTVAYPLLTPSPILILL